MLTFDDPCILFAMRRESGTFLQEFRVQQRFPGAPCWARFCGPAWLTVLVLETGIGQEPTARALEWIAGRPRLGNVPYQPKLILSAGFAGALQEDQQVGDIILAMDVADPDGGVLPTTWPAELPPGEWKPPLRRGRLLTVPGLVGDPQERRALGQKHGAIAVDMESAVVAQHCKQHGIPFGCLRAISDRCDQPLSPRLVSLLGKGRVSPLRVSLALLRSPGLAGEMWRLARQTRRAARQLALALGEVLTLTLPFGDQL